VEEKERTTGAMLSSCGITLGPHSYDCSDSSKAICFATSYTVKGDFCCNLHVYLSVVLAFPYIYSTYAAGTPTNE